MSKAQLRALRDRLYLTDDIPDAALEGDPPYVRPAEGSDAMEYLRARGRVLDGPLPVRVVRPAPALRPDAKVFEEFAAGSGKQAVSTTMVFARMLRNLVRDPTVGSLVAPIVSDEARTFGLEPLIAETKIYAPDGQQYISVDADLPLNYAESSSGQMLQEGITEAGALASFIALATAYATWGQPMVPVYLFYSMFGFQRVGDLAWALGDMRGRGILAGCTAGRTTLMGEGLQHDDGQSPLLASTNPAALVYDASFAYEVAAIVEAAITDMLGPEPPGPLLVPHALQRELPDARAPRGRRRRGGAPGDHRRDLPLRAGAGGGGRPAGLAVFLRAMWSIAAEAQRILAERYGVAADTWAVTSWTACAPTPSRRSAGTGCTPRPAPHRHRHRRARGRPRSRSSPSPTTCAPCPTRWRGSCERPYSVARDRRVRALRRPGALRAYFEVDGAHLVVAVLGQLARAGGLDPRRGRRHRRLRHRRRRHAALRRLNGSGRRSAANAARTSSAPSGTPARACGGRRRGRADLEERAAVLLALRQRDRRRERGVRRRSSRRTAVSSADTATTDERTSARHSSARSPSAAASRLQAMGAGPPGRPRRWRRPATSASRVSSIWPQCWKSSSRRCSRTAPLRSV